LADGSGTNNDDDFAHGKSMNLGRGFV